MDALQLFRAGKLQEAIDALSAGLRDNPSDAKNRTFLFELLCFAGDYSRAEKHLELLQQQSGEAAMGALLYRGALNAERTRQEMFDNKTFPQAGSDSIPQEALGGTFNGKPFRP